MKEMLNLSIGIITKNESVKLKRCIEQLVDYPFEIVVVDTGSTDDTLTMLSMLQDSYDNIHVRQFAWRDDFAAAKNFAVQQTQNDMVMVIDSDEYVQKIDLTVMMQQLTNNVDMVGRIHRRNQVQRNGQVLWNVDWVNRIFNKNKYQYQGRIHEQLVRLDGKQYQTYEAPVSVDHDGYVGTPEQRNAKAYRNIDLLEQELSATGENPYLLYQLGKSYYMAGEYAKAADYFSRGLSFDLEPKLEYVIDMVETYGYALINSGQASTALQFENIYETFCSTSDFCVLMGLIYMNNGAFAKAVEEFERATHCAQTRTEGTNTYIAYYNAGVVEECLSKTEKALRYYRKCEDYTPAMQRIKELEQGVNGR